MESPWTGSSTSTVALGWVDVDVDESSSFHYAHHVHYPKWFFWTSAISGNCCAACSRDITLIGNQASNLITRKTTTPLHKLTKTQHTHTHQKKKNICSSSRDWRWTRTTPKNIRHSRGGRPEEAFQTWRNTIQAQEHRKGLSSLMNTVVSRYVFGHILNFRFSFITLLFY